MPHSNQSGALSFNYVPQSVVDHDVWSLWFGHMMCVNDCMLFRKHIRVIERLRVSVTVVMFHGDE